MAPRKPSKDEDADQPTEPEAPAPEPAVEQPPVLAPSPQAESKEVEMVHVTLFPAMSAAAAYCREKGIKEAFRVRLVRVPGSRTPVEQESIRPMVRTIIPKADYLKLQKEQSGCVRLGR